MNKQQETIIREWVAECQGAGLLIGHLRERNLIKRLNELDHKNSKGYQKAKKGLNKLEKLR